MLKARSLAPAALITLSLLTQGCVFEQDKFPKTEQQKATELVDEAQRSGGAAVTVNENGEASYTDATTGLTVSVNASAVTGLEAGDSFVVQVIPVADTDVPGISSNIEIAGKVYNIKIRSVNTGSELQPSGGMQITLPYGSSINGTDIQKLAIANYHNNEWVVFAADSIDEVKKTVTATITQLSPVAVVKNNAANSAPVAPDYAGTITEGGIYGVKLNATDADGDTLTYSWLDGTTGGKPAYSAGLDAEGNFNYQPLENFNGETVLYYKVTDGELSDTGSISITVTAVNDAPVANAALFDATGNLGSQGEFAASDVDGDTYFTFTIVKQPEHGTVTISGNTYTYTPDTNYEGEDSFEFVSNDGSADSAPATIHVSVTPNYRYVLENGTGDGTSWNNATSSVQSAIDALVALGGGRVLIGPGTFYADAANTPVARIPGNANVELYGGFNGYNLTFAQRPEYMVAESILSGDFDQSGDFSEGDSPNVVFTYGGLIDGVTISGGNGTRGAGIFVNDDQGDVDGSVTLHHVTVSGNQASEMGGGIYALRNNSKNADTGEYLYDAYLVISNSTISDNTAQHGGGIYNVATDLTITDSTLQRNSVTELGGAIYSGGTLSIEGSNISDNTFTVSGPTPEECQAAQSYEEALALGCISETYAAGGGIYLLNASANVTETQIENNTSEWGAGIYLAGQPSLTLNKVSVSSNEATEAAGAIYNEYGLLTISQSQINYNTAENNGGGIYNAAENEQESEEEEEGPGEEGCLGMCEEGPIEGPYEGPIEGPSEGPGEECGLDCMEGGSEEPELTVYEQCDYAESQEEYDALDCDTVFENYETCDELDLYNPADIATFSELQCAEQFPSEFSTDDIPAVFQNCPNDFATVKLTDSELVGNVAGASAGALMNYGAMCVTGTSFRHNSAYAGGAIRNEYSGDGSSLLVTNSSFMDNTASGSTTNSNGGVLYSIGYDSDSVMQNISFSGNSAESNGGAIWVYSNATLRISNFSFYGNSAIEGQDVFVGGINSSNSFNAVNMGLSYGCSEQDLSAYASSYNLFSYAGDFAAENTVITASPFNTAASGELFMDQGSPCADAGLADAATAAFGSLEAWSGLTSDIEYSVTQEASGMVAAGALYNPADLWITSFYSTSSGIVFSTNQIDASCDLYADGELVAEDVQSEDAHNQNQGTELNLVCESPLGNTKSATTIAGGLMVP
ncbi:MAG: Ig-like domain-containing protein [Thalassolituus sp.]